MIFRFQNGHGYIDNGKDGHSNLKNGSRYYDSDEHEHGRCLQDFCKFPITPSKESNRLKESRCFGTGTRLTLVRFIVTLPSHRVIDISQLAGFISKSWHITSHGMFAGSCIGVILLVMSLEFLRRLSKEYDRYILRQYQRAATCAPVYQTHSQAGKTDSDNGSNGNRALATGNVVPATFRPNAIQQAIRATLHMVQFAVAYFVMLLAMYYNGYFIICIIIGAWLGAFVFSRESVGMG